MLPVDCMTMRAFGLPWVVFGELYDVAKKARVQWWYHAKTWEPYELELCTIRELELTASIDFSRL